MFLKILFVLAVVLEFVFVPLFIKYGWPDKCVKSLTTKMISSTLFVLLGVLASQISSNGTPYAKLIIWGLVFGWLGDLFLHLLSDKVIYFAIGVVAFLAGHVFYIAAFQKAIYATYPDASVFTWYEILAAVLVCAAVAFICIYKKLDIPKYLMVGVAVYALTIVLMLMKALRYTIGEWAYGMNDNMVLIFLTVALGGFLFVLSDGSLGYMHAVKKTQKIRIFNLTTYYIAQVLLACSIFLVRTPVLYG